MSYEQIARDAFNSVRSLERRVEALEQAVMTLGAKLYPVEEPNMESPQKCSSCQCSACKS
jgi:hypothetical protein